MRTTNKEKMELPVFPWWTRVAWTKEQIRTRANSDAPNFVRAVMLRHAVGATSLLEALEIADDTMNRIAGYAGVGVVEHTWALYKGQPPRRLRKYDEWRFRNDFVPQGYQLVARVATVPSLIEVGDENNDYRLGVQAKINAFNRDPTIPGPKMPEIHVGQMGFYLAQTPDGLPGSLSATILDIDAVFNPHSWPKR
jgi:hypothetical protein